MFSLIDGSDTIQLNVVTKKTSSLLVAVFVTNLQLKPIVFLNDQEWALLTRLSKNAKCTTNIWQKNRLFYNLDLIRFNSIYDQTVPIAFVSCVVQQTIRW